MSKWSKCYIGKVPTVQLAVTKTALYWELGATTTRTATHIVGDLFCP